MSLSEGFYIGHQLLFRDIKERISDLSRHVLRHGNDALLSNRICAAVLDAQVLAAMVELHLLGHFCNLSVPMNISIDLACLIVVT